MFSSSHQNQEFFPLKYSNNTWIVYGAKKYIKSKWNKKVWQEYKEIFEYGMKVRNSCSKKQGDLSQLFESYLFIKHLTSHFPMSSHQFSVSFVWYDAWATSASTSSYSGEFDQVCLLWNIVVLLSNAAQELPRSDIVSIQKAFANYRYCASICENLMLPLSQSPGFPSSFTQDLKFIAFQGALFKAEAQVCFIQLAQINKAKETTLGPLFQGASNLFQIAYEHGLKLPKLHSLNLVNYAYASYLWNQANANFILAKQLEKQVKFGTAVAVFANALSCAKNAKEISKNNKKFSNPVVDSQFDIIQLQYSKSKDENDRFLGESVPPFSECPKSAVKTMIKLLPSDQLEQNLSEMLGKTYSDPFTALVPKWVETSYENMKDLLGSTLETLQKSITQHNSEYSATLETLNLPSSIQAFDSSSTGLPPKLWEDISSIKSAGGVSNLKSLFSLLRDLSTQGHKDLESIQLKLTNEKKIDDSCRSQWGSRWSAKSSIDLTSSFRAKINEIFSKYNSASNEDSKTVKAIQSNLELLSVFDLSQSQIEAKYLTGTSKTKSTGATPDCVTKIQEILQQLDSLQAQRFTFSHTIEQDRQKDFTSEFSPLVSKLANSEAANPVVNQFVVDKTQQIRAGIDQAYAKQIKLLNSLNTEYAKFKSISTNIDPQLQKSLATLNQSISSYQKIAANLGAGIQFYTAVSSSLNKLGLDVSSYCEARNMERESLLADLKAQGLPAPSPEFSNHSALPVDPFSNSESSANASENNFSAPPLSAPGYSDVFTASETSSNEPPAPTVYQGYPGLYSDNPQSSDDNNKKSLFGTLFGRKT